MTVKSSTNDSMPTVGVVSSNFTEFLFFVDCRLFLLSFWRVSNFLIEAVVKF